MLAESLQKIGLEYPAAQNEQFASHPLAVYIRNDATKELENSLPIRGQGLICKGSAGNGNFASVPWLAIFDPLVTTTARDGYYVVFLYSATGTLYLSLNQGTTAVRREFKSDTREVLRDRAALIRARLAEYTNLLPLKTIDLGSVHVLPRDYEAGHALGCRYELGDQFDEGQLISDLGNAVAAYRALTFRGGLDPSPEATSLSADYLDNGVPKSLIEIRRYRLHRRIERNPRAAELAKFVHGTICQACGFDFSSRYGDVGEGYIEAHHLRPLSSLGEGVAVKLDAEDDFAVLCSNCHRMIHRMDDPSDVDALRKLLK